MDPDDCWAADRFLPDMTEPDALDQVRLLRERAAGIPDTIITSLVGNMITEEALPSYQTYFNMLAGVNEEGSLTSEKGWVKWTKAWTAEENRPWRLVKQIPVPIRKGRHEKGRETIHR